MATGFVQIKSEFSLSVNWTAIFNRYLTIIFIVVQISTLLGAAVATNVAKVIVAYTKIMST